MGRTRRVTFAESAVHDLDDVRDWYVSQDAPAVGDRLVAQVVEEAERLAAFPESGRIVPEFDVPQLRELIYPPFRIVNRLDADRVRIIRVWRSERLLDVHARSSMSGGNMALSAFDEEAHRPEPSELEAVLRGSTELWEKLIAHVAASYPPIAEVWNFGGAKYGWSLRLKREDRIVLYLTPQPGSFLVGVVLGEKAAKAAHEAALSERVLALIDGAPRYAEGRGIRLVVITQEDLDAAQVLAALKMPQSVGRNARAQGHQ